MDNYVYGKGLLMMVFIACWLVRTLARKCTRNCNLQSWTQVASFYQ